MKSRQSPPSWGVSDSRQGAGHAPALLLAGLGSFACLLLGCQTQVPIEHLETTKVSTLATAPISGSPVAKTSIMPRVHNIGSQSIITFEKEGKPNAAPLFIPIFGQGLDNTREGYVTVKVSGTVPIGEREYRGSGQPDHIMLEIDRTYVNRLQSGDRLEVFVSATAPVYDPNDDKSPVAYARRVFTLYEADDYRLVLKNRVPIYDIEAFPLPSVEAESLFGPLIAKNYFVVKLSLRNSDKTEKLVTVGMISATGSAIVQPQDGKETRERIYTVPVRVSPQSPLQVYAVLDGEEEMRTRPWVFRSLEFIGVLGTAATTGFQNTPVDLVKSVSLFTGVGIPEAKKFWPDRWPGYKRNLVNFSLPELIKVPSLYATAPKFIFFSKRDLELVVADQNLFNTDAPWYSSKFKPIAKSLTPSVRVISLAFDNLEIPFETFTAPGAGDTQAKFDLLQVDLPRHRENLRSVQERWLAGGQLTESRTFAEARAVATQLKKLATGVDGLPDTDELKIAVTELNPLTQWLGEANLTSSLLAQTLFQNRGGAVTSLAELDSLSLELATLQRRALADNDVTVVNQRVTDIQLKLTTSQTLLRFVELAANSLAAPDTAKAIETLAGKTADELKAESPERKTVINLFNMLKNARPPQALPKFVSADYHP